MKTFPLRLEYVGEPVQPAAAWFLPGDDPAAWLEDLAQWGVSLENVCLYVVPRTLRDRRPCGILAIVGPGGAPVGPPSPRALPYALLAGKFFVPADARLQPPVSGAELRRLCIWEVAVLHPGCGLVGFGAEDKLRVSDLLHPPPQRAADWSHARPGAHSNARLLSVVPEAPPTLEILFEDLRDDIGSEPPRKLPPAPREANAGRWNRLRLWLRRKIAGALLKGAGAKSSAAGKSPARPPAAKGGSAVNAARAEGAPKRGWLDRLRQRLTARIAAIDAQLEEMRQRELRRLMHLLQTNPEEGLRFALPLSGASSRGLAPPSGRLAPRDPNFNLGKLQGGGPAGVWNAPPQLFEDLRKRYRDLANRELNLQRHRRAAYIFAHLLGDHAAAAAALEQGRHFREAAVLYRDHLKLPLQAARCLEQGGLLSEAIPLYQQCEMPEKVGDLYMRLEQKETAEAAYRQAVVQFRSKKNDLLAAARVLETKLHAPDEALEILSFGWPATAQAGACLRERFALLGRLGRHEETRRLARGLDDATLPDLRVREAADVLADLIAEYPHPEFQPVAADVARVLIGRHLPESSPAQEAALLRTLQRVAPEDQLLVRDAVRYAARRLKARRAAAVADARPAAKGWTVRLERTFRLEAAGEGPWRLARSAGDLFCAVRWNEDAAAQLVQGAWDGRQQTHHWKVNPPHGEDFLLEPAADAQDATLAGIVGGPPLLESACGLQNSLPRVPRAGTPPWMPADACGWCNGNLDTIFVVRRSGTGFVLANYTRWGKLNATVEWPDLPGMPEFEERRVPMVARDELVYLADRGILWKIRLKAVEVIDAGGTVLALEGSRRYTESRVAATLESGGVLVLWPSPDQGRDERQRVASDLEWPVAAFTTDGLLIVANTRRGKIYAGERGQMARQAVFEPPAKPPVALLSAGQAGRFAVLTADGGMHVYQIGR